MLSTMIEHLFILKCNQKWVKTSWCI